MILLGRCMQQGHVNDPTELARSLLLGRGLIDLLLRATFSPTQPCARRDVRFSQVSTALDLAI